MGRNVEELIPSLSLAVQTECFGWLPGLHSKGLALAFLADLEAELAMIGVEEEVGQILARVPGERTLARNQAYSHHR